MGAAGGLLAGSFNTIGTMRKNDMAMNAHLQNKSELEQEAAYVQGVGNRKMSLLKRKQGQVLDQQKSQFARSGVSFDGSVIDFLADTTVEQESERRSLEAETNSEVRRLRLRASREQKAMDDIADWAFFDAMGSFIGGSSSYVGADTGSTASTSSARSSK